MSLFEREDGTNERMEFTTGLALTRAHNLLRIDNVCDEFLSLIMNIIIENSNLRDCSLNSPNLNPTQL